METVQFNGHGNDNNKVCLFEVDSFIFILSIEMAVDYFQTFIFPLVNLIQIQNMHFC